MSKKTQFCKTCSWWEFVFQDADKKFGTCDNDFAIDRIRPTQADDPENDKTIFTEECFGCIYHEIEEGFEI